jgi:hypothetical protein
MQMKELIFNFPNLLFGVKALSPLCRYVHFMSCLFFSSALKRVQLSNSENGLLQ